MLKIIFKNKKNIKKKPFQTLTSLASSFQKKKKTIYFIYNNNDASSLPNPHYKILNGA